MHPRDAGRASGGRSVRAALDSIALAAAAAGDSSLRREVEALLAQESAPLVIDRSIGAQVGPYRVNGMLDAGGMGQVYRATDTRLNRTVAIKVLPPTFADDPQFRARFQREAQTIAGINHPHICTLHDIGQHDGTDYLVLEYLDAG